MIEYLSGDDIYVSILLLRGSPPERTLLLVEGPSDSACLASHLDNSNTETITCFGSRNLDGAMALVDRFSIPGVVAIRDSDWIGILNFPAPSANVVLTDLYDLDASIMLVTEIGDRLCRTFGDPTTVDNNCSSHGETSPVMLAVRIATDIGLLRLVSERHNLELALRDFPVHEVMDPTNGLISREKLVALAIQRSSGARCTADEVLGYMASEPTELTQRLCSGHDLSAVLSVLIYRDWGGSKVPKTFMTKAARAALACTELWSLKFYSDVADWESSTGWIVWKCGPHITSAA